MTTADDKRSPFGENGYRSDVDDEADREDKAYQRIRADDLARDRWRREKASAAWEPPDFTVGSTLADALARPREPIEYIIDRLHVRGGNSTLTAQFKTGKTTCGINVVRSLADGVPFLGEFDVGALDGRIWFWNAELPDSMFLQWMEDVGIRHPERVVEPLNCLGRSFSLMSDIVAEWTVKMLRENDVEFWIVEPWGSLCQWSGINENRNEEVAPLTARIDEIKREAGVSDFLTCAHTGRREHDEGKEHARGATKLDDWASNRWLLTKQNGVRFFAAADGRDTGFEERALDFDPATRRLSLVTEAGGRRVAAVRENYKLVVDAVREKDGINTANLKAAIHAKGITSTDDKTAAIQGALAEGLIWFEPGPNRQKFHHVATQSAAEKAAIEWAGTVADSKDFEADS